MLSKSLQAKLMSIVILITVIGFSLLIYEILREEKQKLLKEKRVTSELMSEPILHSLYKDMLDERADMARYLIEGMKSINGVERIEIIRTNGTEEAFQDSKTLKEVELEYGALRPEWTNNHPENPNNIGKGTGQSSFKNALNLFKEGRKEGIQYIEETEGRSLFTYLVPVEKRNKCRACHTKEETIRGVLMITTSLNDMNAALASSRKELFLYSFLIIFSVCGILFLIIRGVVIRPILQTSGMLKGITEGQGDLTKRIKIASADEVGTMGKLFNEFIQNMQILVKDILTASQSILSISEEVGQSSKGIKKAAENQIRAVNETSDSIVDMDRSIKNISTDAENLQVSAEGASVSTRELSITVQELAGNSESLTTAVDQTVTSLNDIVAFQKKISLHINDLHQQTEQASSAVTEINTSVKEVGSLSKDQAEFANNVVQAVTTYLEEVTQSGQTIESFKKEISKSSSMMAKLGERSKAIGSITNVIDEVSKQTNLLALNAAILAAHAGEQGRGFAVVADEIKILADKSTVSTNQISNLIQEIQKDVEEAVHCVNQSSSTMVQAITQISDNAHHALNNVAENAKTSLDMAKNIEVATEEQVQGSGHVANSISKINKMVDDIKASVDHQSQASDEILKATKQMQQITVSFKVSTAEQSKGTIHILNVIDEVKNKMKDMATAIQLHKSASERVVKAIEVIKKETEENIPRTQNLDQTVSKLNEQEALLKEKMGIFKV